MAASQTVEPNLLKLRGAGIEVTYSSTAIDGKPHLDVKRGRRIQNFTGNEIRSQKTEIATLITVTLDSVPDAQIRTLTVAIPTVNLPDGKLRQAVNTFAVITTAKTTIGGPRLVQGVVQTYRTISLRGTAKLVNFLAASKGASA